MKSWGLLLFISFCAQAQHLCQDGDHISTQAHQLAAHSCDVTDKMLSCASKPTPPANFKEKVEKMFHMSEEKKEAIQKDWGVYKNSNLGWLYHYDAQIAQFDHKYVPQPVYEWMKEISPELDHDQFQKSMVDSYIEYSNHFGCIPKMKSMDVVKAYPLNASFSTLKELNDSLNSPGSKEAKDNFFKEFNSQATKNHVVCSPTQLASGPWETGAMTIEPCAGNVTGHYVDNEWNRSDLDSKLNDPSSSALVECIKNRKALGAKIHHISISTSSSALNNTGKAAKYFCAKGFLGLAQARAEAAKMNLLPELFKKAGGTINENESKVILDFNGTNKDGTSGPCPYMIKDGHEVLKDEYQTSAGKKKLDENKFVRIQVTFEPITRNIATPTKKYMPFYRCRKLSFECLPARK